MSQREVQGIIDYFKGPHWTNFITRHLVHENDDVYHAHIYVDTCVDPGSLRTLMAAYWEAQSLPLVRRMDPISPKPDVIAMHSVTPTDRPAFDFFMRYNPEVVLSEMPAEDPHAEQGYNALSWGRDYQNEFLKNKGHQFKVVGPSEDAYIRKFFQGKQWKECIEHVLDEKIVHCHMNVEIGFDPKILELFAREALAKMGWTVERAVPSVYEVKKVYTGKIIFLLGHPEEVFDICWKYNPDVVIRRAAEGWQTEEKGFDLFYVKKYWDIVEKEKDNYYYLTEEELQAVISSFRQ